MDIPFEDGKENDTESLSVTAAIDIILTLPVQERIDPIAAFMDAITVGEDNDPETRAALVDVLLTWGSSD